MAHLSMVRKAGFGFPIVYVKLNNTFVYKRVEVHRLGYYT